MKILFNIGVLFLCYALNAQNEYAVDKMNPALRKNADAVIRIKELIYTIETIGSATSSKNWW